MISCILTIFVSFFAQQYFWGTSTVEQTLRSKLLRGRLCEASSEEQALEERALWSKHWGAEWGAGSWRASSVEQALRSRVRSRLLKSELCGSSTEEPALSSELCGASTEEQSEEQALEEWALWIKHWGACSWRASSVEQAFGEWALWSKHWGAGSWGADSLEQALCNLWFVTGWRDAVQGSSSDVLCGVWWRYGTNRRRGTVQLFTFFIFMITVFTSGQTCDREVAGSNLTRGCCVPTPTQRAIPPWSVKSWGVNGHTTRCTSPVSMVSQLRLVSGWGLMIRRSAPPYVPVRLGKVFTYSEIKIVCCRPLQIYTSDLYKVTSVEMNMLSLLICRVRTIMWKPDSAIVDTIGQNNRPMR